jgi:hypothetical protein
MKNEQRENFKTVLNMKIKQMPIRLRSRWEHPVRKDHVQERDRKKLKEEGLWGGTNRAILLLDDLH